MSLCNGTTNGRSPIIVTAIGEESFKDADRQRLLQCGRHAWPGMPPTRTTISPAAPMSGQPKPWQDTSEPFLNEWELYDTYGTPIYVARRADLDFNNNGCATVRTAWCKAPCARASVSST